MGQFKKIYIDKESGRNVDFVKGDLIISQKVTQAGSSQLRGVVYKVNTDNIIILNLSDNADWSFQDIVRIGNEEDITRQSCIVIAAEGLGSPYQSFLSGIDSFKAWDSGKGRNLHIGNLDHIKDMRFPSASGDGIMLDNAYIKGEFILKSTGASIETIIEANAKGILQAVKKGSVVSEINQTAEKITIKAEKINIDGLVPHLKSKFIEANRLDVKNINFDNAKGKNMDLSGNIDAQTGKFGDWIIAGGKLISKDSNTVIYSNGEIELTNPLTGKKVQFINDELPSVSSSAGQLKGITAKTVPVHSSFLDLDNNVFKSYLLYAKTSGYTTKSLEAERFNLQANKTYTINIADITKIRTVSPAECSVNINGYMYVSLMQGSKVLKKERVDFYFYDYAGHVKGDLHLISDDLLNDGSILHDCVVNSESINYTSTFEQVGCFLRVEYVLKGASWKWGGFNKPAIKNSIKVLPYGMPISVYKGDPRSVISPTGMRIYNSGGAYFEVDTKADDPMDFVKMVWAGKEYGLVINSF